MPLIIPISGATYGDSTTTEGGTLRKYVLAQFRTDADLEWVKDLRAALVRSEVKYRDLVEARPRLKERRDLWRRIENGVGQASIIVIDPQPFDAAIRKMADAEGRVEGRDFDHRDLTEACASAIIAGTPLAYLPHSLAEVVPWEIYSLGDLEAFTPQAIRAELGPGLRKAQIFAARAHALFDLKNHDASATSTRDVFRSPLARVMLAELLATTRVYDAESPVTLPVLNRSAVAIATALEDGFPGDLLRSATPLVKEVDSRAVDHIQAADVAAGWAREIIDVSDARSLGARFERVWLNGTRTK